MRSGDVIMFVLGLPHHFAAFGKMMKISSYFFLQSLCSPLTGQTLCITMLSKKSRFEELQLNTNLHINIATFFLAGWIFLPASEIFTDQVCRMPSAGNIFDTHRETSGASSPQWRPYQGEWWKIFTMRSFNSYFSWFQLFMEVNPKQIEPLLIEIFDMNKQNWHL